MRKVVIIPDSFKGTLTSVQICEIMRQAVLCHSPGCIIHAVPVADGGEGTVTCFLSALGGELIEATVKGPYLAELPASYGILKGGKTAVVEMASCAGLPLVEHRKNPMLTSTYGVGQLILDAARRGCTKIILGLGGSCTNDGGCGAAAAAGVRFYNAAGNSFIPAGGTLRQITRIDLSGRSPLLEKLSITAMCDIDNPLYGPNGAAYVFAPQKGADQEMTEFLDQGLRNLSEKITHDLGFSISGLPGAGAAGGMGAGMVSFFGASLKMGIETVLDTIEFERLIQGADLVLTGEGKLDTQSLRGKAVIGIAKRAHKCSVPVVAVVGGAEAPLDAAYDLGLSAAFTINQLPEDFSVSRSKSVQNLRQTMDNLLRLILAVRK